jgi:hypothetical protein
MKTRANKNKSVTNKVTENAANEQVSVYNDTEHAEALQVNNVFNAVSAANPLQNSVLTLEQAEKLTATAQQIAATAKVKTQRTKKEKQVIAYIVFLRNLIASGQYTAKQLSAMCAAQFSDVKLSTINTTITDAKNAKYTRFGQVAIMDKATKIYSFASAATEN